ncbi:MAG: hypothetical protein IJ220_03910 [Clostridia bacterium]|nr:hypothetical protein [Clostridia bacterium]
MKAEDTRKKLISELNAQLSELNGRHNIQIKSKDSMKSFSIPAFEKPKLFEPQTSKNSEISLNTLDTQSIKGIGFKEDNHSNSTDYTPKEIYNMKEFIQSNPENMQTFSYDVKVVKAQLALVKKKEWQDILFEDVDWFKKIDLTSGIKKFLRI